MLFRAQNAEKKEKEISVPLEIWLEIGLHLNLGDFRAFAQLNKLSNKVAASLLPALLKKLAPEKRQELFNRLLKTKPFPKKIQNLIDVFLKCGVDVNWDQVTIFANEQWISTLEWLVDNDKIEDVNKSLYINEFWGTLLAFACKINAVELAIKLIKKKDIIFRPEDKCFENPFYWVKNLKIIKAFHEKMDQKFVEEMFSYSTKRDNDAKKYISEQKELYLKNPANPLIALQYAFAKENVELASQLLKSHAEKLIASFTDFKVLYQFIIGIKSGYLIQLVLSSDVFPHEMLRKIFSNQNNLLTIIQDSRPDYQFITTLFEKNLVTPQVFAFVYDVLSSLPETDYLFKFQDVKNKLQKLRTANEPLADFLDSAKKVIETLKKNLHDEYYEPSFFRPISLFFDQFQKKMADLVTLLNKIIEDPEIPIKDHIDEISKQYTFEFGWKSMLERLGNDLTTNQNKCFDKKTVLRTQ